MFAYYHKPKNKKSKDAGKFWENVAYYGVLILTILWAKRFEETVGVSKQPSSNRIKNSLYGFFVKPH